MISTAPPSSPSSVRTQAVVLLPAEKFFVRRIPLTSGQNVALQVELALETFGPFAPAQIFHGFCPSRDGKQALLFAAYRKNFTAEEIASWTMAEVVLPEFALWLAPATPPPAGCWLYEQDEVLHLVAWDGNELPAGLLFKKLENQTTAEAAADELLHTASERLGVPHGSPRRLGGNFVIENWSKDGLSLKLDKPGQTMTALLPAAMARSMDVRDKAELASLSQQHKRTLWLWRAFVGMAACLVLCLVAEAGLMGAGKFLERQQAVVKANEGPVHLIEQANMQAARIEKMAGQRLKPLEMLVAINRLRPKSMVFNKVSTSSNNPRVIEVDAEVGNVADLNDYVPALKKSPGIENVETKNTRSMSGITTFSMKVTFKPGFPQEADRK